MSGEEKNRNTDAAGILQDPELSLDDAVRRSLSPEDLRTAERQRLLDQKLKAAARELRRPVDERAAAFDAAAFQIRLRNALQHVKQDDSSYPGRLRWRELGAYFREKLFFSETAGITWAGAVAALVAVIVLPLVLSQSAAVDSSATIALNDTSLSVAEEADVAAPGPSAVPERPGATAGASAPRMGAPPPAGDRTELALADGQAHERGTMMPTEEARDTATVEKKAALDMVAFQERMLRDQLARATTPEEKRPILRKLLELYQNSGQDARARETRASLDALK